MNPADNVPLATYLATPPKTPPTEASLRGACGRAYYAAFCSARDALLVAFKMAFSGADHARVASLLKRSSDAQVATAGSLLEQLHEDRKRADYDVGVRTVKAFTVPQAQMAVLLAKGVIDEVNRAMKKDKRLFIPPGVT